MRRPHAAAVVAGLSFMVACATAVPYASPDAAASGEVNAGQRVDWNQAIALLRSGRVLAVTQLHDLSVTLTTDDGKHYATKEPTIDAILTAIMLNAPNAQSIIVATE